MVWTALTPRIDPADIGSCSGQDCDGQFLLDDGVTYYSRDAAGFDVVHDDDLGGCLALLHAAGDNVVRDRPCADSHKVVCKASPP